MSVRPSARLVDRADAMEEAERRWLGAQDARARATHALLNARGGRDNELRYLQSECEDVERRERELLALARSFLIAWREEKEAHARAEAKAQEEGGPRG